MNNKKMLLIDPDICLQLWRDAVIHSSATTTLHIFSSNGIYQRVVSYLLNKQRECISDVENIVKYVDALIEDNLGLTDKVWGLEPDTCTVYVFDEDRKENVQFVPMIRTQNSYTYQSLCEILFDMKNIKQVTFKLSEKCNLNCRYCFEDHKDTSVLSIDQAKIFLDQMFTDENMKSYLALDDSKAISFVFMGGEPLLHVDLIDQICDYFYDCCVKYDRLDLLMNHRFDITTNGTLYFREDVQYLLDKHPDIFLSISLDGTKECHDSERKYVDGTGSFDDVVAAVKEESKRGRLRTPKMTFSKNTIKYIYENVVFMSTLGYPSIYITPALEDEYTKEDGIAFYNELLKVADFLVDNDVPVSFFNPLTPTFSQDRPKDEAFCGGEGIMLTLHPNGRYYTCHRMYESGRSLSIGDINVGLFGTDEYKETYDYIVKNRVFSKKWPDKCENCKFRGGCNGCPAINYEKDGNLEGEVNVNGCYLSLAKFAAATYYQAKRFGSVKQKYIEEYKDLFLSFLPEDEVETLIMIENM